MAQATIGSRLSARWHLSLSSARANAPLLLAAVLLGSAALAIRLWAISDKSIWLDEAQSWRYAKMSLPHMFDYTGAVDKTPPLYYTMLHFWIQPFGDSEGALRSLSALAGALTVVLLAAAAWRIQGALLAVIAAALLLMNSTNLYFSQEVRTYALTGFLAIAASIALGACLVRPSVLRAAGYGALLAALIYSHYSGFVVLAAHAPVLAGYGLLGLWRDRSPVILAAGGAAFTVAGLAYIPWLSNLRQIVGVGDPAVPTITRHLVFVSFKGGLGLQRASDFWFILALGLLIIGAFGVARRWRDPRVVSLASLALVPVGQAIISVISKPVFDLRQISPYVPGLLFVLALGIVDTLSLTRRFAPAGRVIGQAAIVALVAALFAFMVRSTVAVYTQRPIEDWRAAAADLRGFDGPIYITADYMVAPFNYYYDGPAAAYVFGLWSADALPLGQAAMVIISHTSPEPVLASLGSNVSIEGQRSYHGILFYEVRVQHRTTMNVSVPFDNPGSGWSINPFGYLQTNSDLSPFTCECTLDTNNDGLADEAFSMVIEYYDTGTTAFQLFGPSRDVVLGSQPRTNTIQWLTTQIDIPAGAPVSDSFGLSNGIVLRRLQVMRTHVENADLFGSYQGATRWLLRADGYLQSTNQYSYIDSTLPIDADNDGTIDRSFVFELEYRGSASNKPRVFGLRPGNGFTLVQQDAQLIRGNGEWQTIQIVVDKGERLQPRFFVGRGVRVGRVAFLPAGE